jgi:hypothetical protein
MNSLTEGPWIDGGSARSQNSRQTKNVSSAPSIGVSPSLSAKL